MIRLNKYLASIGIDSRRKIDQMISEEKIKVNEKKAQLGQKIDPQKDKIFLNNQLVKTQNPNLIYILLNKPVGYVCTTQKFKKEKNILELVHCQKRIYPVGRLDKNSQGLIILTNDGELTQKLTHPKYHLKKIYKVKIIGNLTDKKLTKLRNGIELEEGKTQPTKVEITSKKETSPIITLEFTLKEGKKRQIRRMCSAVNLHVVSLTRTQIGTVKLEKLKPGKWRRLSKEEVGKLKN